MASLGSFSKRMKVRSKDFEGRVNESIQKLAFLVEQTIVLATPVDTGHARANWIVTVDTEHHTVVEAEDKVGRETLQNAKASLSARKPEQTIVIQNNVKYIAKLNDGSSAQAPKLFVQKAIGKSVTAFGRRKVIS